MASKTGNKKLIEQLLADGLDVMFGNPGTVEQGFLDALSDYPDMRYVLTLHESVAIMMADAYARATKKPALAQIHSTPGLGNAIGAMYQAMRGHAPLVVIGGDAGMRYLNMEAQMYGDLLGFARPVTKWATTVTDERSLLRVIRRAVKIASTPPMGPVYVCLPADVLDRINDEPVFPSTQLELTGAPTDEALSRMAKALIEADDPHLFVGDGVAYAHAQPEVERLAELLGAKVYGVDSGELNIRYSHPCYMGQTGHMFGESSLPITRNPDALLIVGTYMLPEVFPALGEVYGERAAVIHIDSDPDAIAKNHRVDMAALCGIRPALRALVERIQADMTPERAQAASKRLAALKKPAPPMLDGRSEVLCAFLEALREAAPDAAVFDEALTSSDLLTHFLPPVAPGRFQQTRGGSLGVGIPGAMAMKLCFPDDVVVGFTGDGGSMYTIQALWTAAHERIGAKFVVLSNRAYGLLQNNIKQYWAVNDIEPHAFPDSFSLVPPQIDFARLAAGQGVPALRLDHAEDAKRAVGEMLQTDGPFLIDLIL